MGKIAFVFPGQGAQYPGMGRELYEAYPEAAEVFKTAELVKPGISEICFELEGEALSKTSNTQPCMLAVELAAAAALEREGIKPDYVAGFSLGELAALTYSEAFSLKDGFEIVTKRGVIMQEAAEKKDTAMAAVLKLTDEQIEELCREFKEVYPVNYNCPGQLSVAGAKEEIKPFMARVKEIGGKALPLKVSGGFHSPFMDEAAAKFGVFLDGKEIHKPKIETYSNYTGKIYRESFRKLLTRQVNNPVRWSEIIQDMIKNEVDIFVEMGPGNTLSSMIKRIDSNVLTVNIENTQTLNEAVRQIRERV